LCKGKKSRLAAELFIPNGYQSRNESCRSPYVDCMSLFHPLTKIKRSEKAHTFNCT